MDNLVSATQSGDRRRTLVALRDRIAATIDSCESGRDMAALSKRLMEVIDEIDSMPSEVEEDTPLARARRKIAS